MKKIPFNSFVQLNYTNSFNELFANYDNFREKLFSKRCLELLQPDFPDSELFLTHSATGALEMIALLMDIKPGDEVILPSFTFVSTANAFVSRGAVPVFVDIREEDFNIDPVLVERMITPRTRAIIAVHYAGNACQMELLMDIATRHNLFLIEDAAMAFGCDYKGQSLGSIGHFGVISFDITKQLTAVQGGLCIINDKQFMERASNVYHIGTNRSAFNAGETTYYEWVDVGSKFQMNELGAVVLYEQLKNQEQLRKELDKLFEGYYTLFVNEGFSQYIPEVLRNRKTWPRFKHSFYLLLENQEQRAQWIEFFKGNHVEAFFHYSALHKSDYYEKVLKIGKVFLPVSDKVSKCALRMPFHHEVIPHYIMLRSKF